jgi:CRISPR/Cas system endoribonuclease Cas6 (RAMP superfamily)
MYEVKEFMVGFCLEALEKSRAPNLHHLTLETRAAAAAGTYDFLPCPPSVFSRTVTEYDRFMNPVRVMYN